MMNGPLPKRIALLLRLLLLMPLGLGAAISDAEYFFDSIDNGPGNNISLSLSVTDGVATATANNLSTSGLSSGVHILYTRLYEDSYGWGLARGKTFLLRSEATVYSISAGEYFIDNNDNGAGSNTSFSVTLNDGIASATVTDISTTELDAGLHIIYTRLFADNYGWGAPRGYPFLVTGSSSENTITAAEYFVDLDPGQGNGSSLTLGGSATDVTISADFDLSAASVGPHALFVRLYSPQAGWGPKTSALFLVEEDSESFFIQSAEYFIGDEPENSDIITISNPEDGTFDELAEALALTDIPIPDGASDLQSVGVRFQRSDGEWSAWRTTQFLIENDNPLYTLAGAEYYIDSDPGIGLAQAIDLPDDGAYDEVEEEFDFPVPMEGLAEGGHFVYLRLQRSDGSWGPSRGSYFIVSENAQPTIAAAEYYVNPATAEGGGIAFSPLDGVFNTTEESVQAIANMASLNAQDPGNYTLYVRYMNSRNEWGPASSQPFIVQIRPQITTSLDTLDFGALFTGETRVLDFSISNIGDADLVISELSFSDAAYTSDWDSGTIVPFGSETFNLTFAPIDPANSHPATMTIVNNDADKIITLAGVGLDTAPIMVVGPDSLDFGTVQTIANSTMSVRVSNIGNEHLVLSGATSTDPAFSASIPNPTVVPEEYVDVDITFAPSLGQTYSDTLYLISNDTYFPSYPIYVTGVGSVVPVPDIQVSVETLEFGNLALSEAPVSQNFIIHNAGTEVLNLTSSSIDEAAFTSDLALNTLVNPSNSLSVKVSFTPNESRRYMGTMTLFNDDPDSPEINIALSGSSVFPGMVLSSNTFNFGEVGVTTNSTQSLIITNIGSDTLKISSFEKSASIDTILSISPSSFNVNPAGGLRNFSLVFSPAEPLEYEGIIVIVSNDDNDTLYISGTGLDDEAPEIVFDPGELEDIGTTENSSITISAPISDNNLLSWVRLYYRQGGKSVYDSTNMELSAGIYQADIPPAYVRNRGVEYYIKAFDGANAQTMPETAPDVPAIIRVRLPSLPPFTFVAEKYGMISVPSDLDQKNVQSILIEELGDYNVNDWRLFRWINGNYVELSENANFTFDPGNAYWLITSERQVITLDSSTSVKTNEEYLISLDHGWNQVGTPYYFPVSWEDVYAASPGVVQGSIAYEWVNDEWQPATKMQPFGGYFISTPSGGSILRFPPKESVNGTAKSAQTIPALSESEWLLQVSAENSHSRDLYNFIGVLNDADMALDIRDQPKPPAMYNDRIEIFSEHQDWGQAQGRYSGDYQRRNPQGNYWDLHLKTGSHGKDIALSLKRLNDLPEGFNIRVLNLDLRYELNELEKDQYSQRIFLADATYTIRILVGNEEFLQENDEGIAPAPKHFRLSQNFPNPFNGDTRIQYDVPEPSLLRVVVYDMLGREVRELIRSESHPVGYHQISWNGTDQQGHPVASGIYLVSFQSKNFQASKKLVLLK